MRHRHFAGLGGAILAAALLAGCSAQAGYPMDEAPSVNHNSRINHLVIHFTSENHAESMRLLTQASDAPVSAHYLIPDPRDPTWGQDRVVVQRLVPEARRAWHAGRSVWAGENTLNNRSIGIEIVNESRCETPAGMNEVRSLAERQCSFLPFDEAQIETLILLARDILARHPDIDPVDVIGHADITPARRVDPGPLFPWQRLHAAGIGAWPEPALVVEHRQRLGSAEPDPALVRRALAAYGYDVAAGNELDSEAMFALQAFQMHFRPSNHDGAADLETLARLLALIEEFRPQLCRQAEHADLCIGAGGGVGPGREEAY